MNTATFETVVDAPRHVYSALAFTPAFDAFIMREFDLGTIVEHAEESARASELGRDLFTVFGAPEWRAWRASLAGAPISDALASGLTLEGATDDRRTTGRRTFRFRPASRIASAVGTALYWLGYGADVVHYDALQIREAANDPGSDGAGEATMVRFFLRAEALAGFAVEGVTTFHDVKGAPDRTMQRVRIAVTTGSWMLDRAAAPFIEAVLRPEFARMGEAIARWNAAQE